MINDSADEGLFPLAERGEGPIGSMFPVYVPGKLYTLYVMQWPSIPERIRRMSGAPVFLLGVLCTQKEMRVDVLYQEEVVQVWLSSGGGFVNAWLEAIEKVNDS